MSTTRPLSSHPGPQWATFTASDGCRLDFDDPGGRGRPVVLLHAWGLNSGMWHPLVPRMQRAGLRPITIDRRGHGTSDRPRTGYDLDTLVADIEGVIDHLGLADVAIVGHSLGAMEAATIAARNTSGEITSLVLSATTTPCLTQSDTNSHGVPAAMFEASRDLMRADMASWVTDNTAGYWGSTGIERPIEHVWTQQALFSTPTRVLLALHETMTAVDLRDELATLTVPVLVIHGTNDLSSPPQITAHPTAELVPNAQLHLIEGAGHGLYASHTDDYLDAVITHLHGHPEPSTHPPLVRLRLDKSRSADGAGRTCSACEKRLAQAVQRVAAGLQTVRHQGTTASGHAPQNVRSPPTGPDLWPGERVSRNSAGQNRCRMSIAQDCCVGR